MKSGGRSKNVIVSFDKAFHGRTLGAQQAGGIPALKEWIVNLDAGFVQVPFPDGFRTPDTSFGLFERSLRESGIEPQNVAGVILETYQGGSAAFAPAAYMRDLRAWCDGPQSAAGVRRSAGRLRPYRHAVGLRALRHRAGSGALRQGHLQFAAAVRRGRPPGRHGPATRRQHDLHPYRQSGVLRRGAGLHRSGARENLAENARRVGGLLHQKLCALASRTPQIGRVDGKGLVAGVACVVPGTKEPDGALAYDVVRRAVEKGVLMFSPVGYGGATIKICPPLVITEAAILDSLAAFEEAFAQAVEAQAAA